MDQIALDFNPVTLARRRDPETSKAAAGRAVEFKGAHDQKVYDAVCAAGERGATMYEAAAATGLSAVQVCRRFAGLGERGYIQRRYVEGTNRWQERGGCAVWFRNGGG